MKSLCRPSYPDNYLNRRGELFEPQKMELARSRFRLPLVSGLSLSALHARMIVTVFLVPLLLPLLRVVHCLKATE